MDYLAQRVRRALRLTPKPPQRDEGRALLLQRIRDIAKAEESFGHCSDPNCTAKQAIKEIASLLGN